VFTLPAEIAAIAFHNKALVYDLLFKTAAETMLTIADDPKHLGARIGITAVLHTWGSALTHHPHVHMIVPGGGIAPDGQRWVSSRPAFLLPVRVLGALFRRLFLTRLLRLHDAGQLAFFGKLAGLADRRAFLRQLSPVRKKRWVVYAKPPFAGPEAVLAYLSRYTHRVAISNSRLLAFDQRGLTFRYKDYRRSGPDRQQVMTLPAEEFIRRFLLHVLPTGFHRIRHYGLLASGTRKASLALARQLLAVAPPPEDNAPEELLDTRPPCPCCGDAGRVARPRLGRHLDPVELRIRVGHRRHRVHGAERAPAVPAGPAEGDVVAFRTNAAMRHASRVVAIDREEGADTVLVRSLRKQVTHPAQIATALLANRSDEQDRVARGDLARIHRPGIGEQRGEAACIVANARRVEPGALAAHLDRSALREHGVNVRGDHHQLCICISAGSQCGHIALRIDGDLLKAERLEPLGKAWARTASLRGGAGISVSVTISSTKRS